MLHTEVVFFNLAIYSLIQKRKLFVRAWLLFNIITILAKKVLNYFEVMINYIIALTLHARRNNLMSLCPYQHYQWWYYDCREFLLDWLCCHSWTQNLCIKKGESDLHWPRFSSCHDIPPQFSSVKADGQQMWVRQKEFVHVLHLTELSTSSLLNHIASPGMQGYSYYVFNHDFKVVVNFFS